MHTEHAVGLSLRKELNRALHVLIRLCSGVGCEREASNLVFDALALEFLLCLPYPGNFRVCIDHGWDYAVVDMAMASCDEFSSGNTCLLG